MANWVVSLLEPRTEWPSLYDPPVVVRRRCASEEEAAGAAYDLAWRWVRCGLAVQRVANTIYGSAGGRVVRSVSWFREARRILCRFELRRESGRRTLVWFDGGEPVKSINPTPADIYCAIQSVERQGLQLVPSGFRWGWEDGVSVWILPEEVS